MARSLDILQLSDAFRQVGSPLRSDLVTRKLVGLARLVVAHAEQYAAQDRDPGYIKAAEDILRKSVTDLANATKTQGYATLVLPLSAKNNWGGDFQAQIIEPAKKISGVDITFCEEEFAPNYQGADNTIETCLDEGYRAMAGVLYPEQVIALTEAHPV